MTSTTDQIDGIIFQLPFDDKIKLWELIDKLVEENRTEISDEEIVSLANEHILYNDSKRSWVIEGMKLYREQLKTKP
jgi:hypothetical protein